MVTVLMVYGIVMIICAGCSVLCAKTHNPSFSWTSAMFGFCFIFTLPIWFPFALLFITWDDFQCKS